MFDGMLGFDCLMGCSPTRSTLGRGRRIEGGTCSRPAINQYPQRYCSDILAEGVPGQRVGDSLQNARLPKDCRKTAETCLEVLGGAWSWGDDSHSRNRRPRRLQRRGDTHWNRNGRLLDDFDLGLCLKPLNMISFSISHHKPRTSIFPHAKCIPRRADHDAALKTAVRPIFEEKLTNIARK